MKAMRKMLLAGAATSLMLFSAQGMAQTTPVEDAATQPGDIVVTAQKRPELLSKAPAAISAVSGGDLRSAGVVDVTSLTNLVPSAQISQANGVQITIRGVSSPDGTEKGDPSAAFMLNGVYLARQQSLSGAFFDIERVEVLRGPQGTLYGRNATAGVVNIITKRPTFELEAFANGEYSNYDTQRFDAMVNIPISDNFAVRAAGAFNKHDTYMLNANGSNKGIGGDQNEKAARVSALWEFGNDRQGSLYLVGDYSHQGGTPNIAQVFRNLYTGLANPLYIGGSSKDIRTLTFPVSNDARRSNDIYSITGEFNYDFGGIGLTYLGSYRVFDQYEYGTRAYPKPGFNPQLLREGKNKAQSHELRLATTNDGPIEAVAGLYYFREKTDNLLALLEGFGAFDYYGFLQRKVIGESKAVFGQATWKPIDGLRLTGGIRYSEDDKSRVGITATQRGGNSFDPALYTLIANNDANVKFDQVTWKLGADYEFTDKVMGYATVSTGYKAGGFNDGCSSSASQCVSPISEALLYYDPEKMTAYEAGLKGRYLDNSLSLNLTGFYYDYKDLQLSAQVETGVGLLTQNAGQAKVKGAEIEAIITPTRTDRIDISVALLDAHYTSYKPTATTDWSGRKLDNSPSYVIFAAYTKTFDLASGAKIDAHVESRFSSSYLMSDFNVPTQFEQPSFTKTNATLTFTAPEGRWYLQGFVKNIENKVTLSGYEGGRFFTSEPRLYGVRAGMKY